LNSESPDQIIAALAERHRMKSRLAKIDAN
jgi:hypothetical protein